MSPKPLIIYLDTQDYIRLFNEERTSTTHQILAKLTELKNSGDVVFGFSWAIMFEFVTKPSEQFRTERVRRGQLVKDICGSNAFPFPTEFKKGGQFPNAGRWMPGKEGKLVTAKEFRRKAYSKYLQHLAERCDLNRFEKRRLRRPQAMNELLRKSTSKWGARLEDFQGIPVSKEFVESGIVNRFLKGRCTDSEFESRLNSWFSDPAEYSRIVYDFADKPNLLQEYYGVAIEQFETFISKLQSYHRGHDELEAHRAKLRQNYLELGLCKRKARELTKSKVNREEFDPEAALETLANEFGQERISHFRHYIDKAQKPSYRFKKSDVLDLMQMMYVNECDLFRCDKAMGDLFKDFHPFRGKLVKRFDDLPSLITEKFAERLI